MRFAQCVLGKTAWCVCGAGLCAQPSDERIAPQPCRTMRYKWFGWQNISSKCLVRCDPLSQSTPEKIPNHIRPGNYVHEMMQLAKTQWFVLTWVSFCRL